LASSTKKQIGVAIGVLMGLGFLAPSVIPLVSSILNATTAPAAVAPKGDKDGSVLSRQAEGYSLVLKREPNNMSALMGLIQVRRQQGRIPEAIALLEKAQQSGADPSVTLSLAELYQQTNQTAKALTAYDQLMVLIPDFLPAMVGKAVTLKKAGKLKEAEALYLKALTKAPDNVKPQVMAAYGQVPTTVSPLEQQIKNQANQPKPVLPPKSVVPTPTPPPVLPSPPKVPTQP